MTPSLEQKYRKHIQDYSEKLKATNHRIRLISTLRLLLAISGIITFYFALTANIELFYLLLASSIVFTLLVLYHNKLFRKRSIEENYLRINQEELSYINYDYSPFYDGREFTDSNHPYSLDLDLFGEGSVFQSINRTVTLKGKNVLAELLTHPRLQANAIVKRQQGILELKNRQKLLHNFRATGLLVHEEAKDHEKLKLWVNQPSYFIQNKFLPFLLIALPLVAFAGLGLSIVYGKIHSLLIASALINWIYIGYQSKKINLLFAFVSRKKSLLQNYSDLLSIIEKEKFHSQQLQEIGSSLANASHSLQSLSSLVGWFDQRLNILVIPFLNTFLLFDLQCCYRIEKWKSLNDQLVLRWLEELGNFDALSSLANFAINNPSFSTPEITSGDNLHVHAENLAHPLLPVSIRIANNFTIGYNYKIALVTGANMAGKSTFLRAIGVNMVMAYAGAPVCAHKFSLAEMEIISSMRISDSLKDHTSYFYAELQRLKFIKEKASQGKPLFLLLDEMLKGTNSKDKQQGSMAFVESLLNYSCLGIVATHDLLLGQLESTHPTLIHNFCFESFLAENKLLFDYKIREGLAQNTNASFLMKDLGII